MALVHVLYVFLSCLKYVEQKYRAKYPVRTAMLIDGPRKRYLALAVRWVEDVTLYTEKENISLDLR